MKINPEQILNEFNSFINSLGDKNKQRLISFAFHLEHFDALRLIDHLKQNYEEIFFFRTPNNRQTIIGINSALEIAIGQMKNFASLVDNFNYWKNNFVNNWNEKKIFRASVLCCSAKFDSMKSSRLWNEFETLRLYIPEFIFSFQNDEVFVFYNFIDEEENKTNSTADKLFYFLTWLEEINIYSIQSSIEKTNIQFESNENGIKTWKDLVLQSLNELNNGGVDKLVLSRALSFKADSAINWGKILNELFDRFPDCYLFFIKKFDSVFFGSSPEMFLKVLNNIAEVESVAGSAPRGEKSESDYEFENSLKTSKKNHQEHLFVSDFISDILIKYSDNVRIIEEKQIRKLDNIQHLITRISAELNSKENLFEMIDALFPTPAVCGVPKESAMNLIRKLESHDRGLYSGIVGFIDFEGNCELAVSIRSALFKDNLITAFAGAGLVKNSDPEDEFLETNLKLNTILSLFINENKS
ncbi:MAG: isochorismate synthase [Ignavibacteriaceae bacterium]|nr:isochorismate synthase [Ignavibacteriaceae bacterium]